MFKSKIGVIGAALFGLFILSFPQSSFAKNKTKESPPRKSASTFEYRGPPVSFEQVFQNPNDTDLKLNYARQQAASGDFLSAATALEGMLYISSDWDSARLFYAIVLAELDDNHAATYEFNILANRPISAADMAITEAYLKKLNAERGE